MDLLARVRRAIRRHRIATPTTRVAAALSGGSDSVALVHLLRALDCAGDLQLVGIVHFNHQLRTAAADDEQFSATLAAALELPFVAGRADVAAQALVGPRRDRRDGGRLDGHSSRWTVSGENAGRQIAT